MNEIEALQAIDDALAAIDKEARGRVINWVCDKYAHTPVAQAPLAHVPAAGSQHASASKENSARGDKRPSEIAGIAHLGNNSEFQLTVRDLKASSKNDAAVRLVHLVVRAYERMLGETPSSRKVVTPALKYYRVYDGNTRAAIANEKGIVRSGDSLSLDAHGQADADHYITEALDPKVVGTWSPKKSSTRARKAMNKS